MKLSIVIPIYNEELVLPKLYAELFTELDQLSMSYEVLFVDDGSKDLSLRMLYDEAKKRPQMKVVVLDGNFGQHQAIIAGFSVAQGDYVITLDADLQTPPSEIAKISTEMDKGFDYVGSIREQRNDVFWRRFFSKLNNQIRKKITRIQITDQGCMLRGYSRRLAQQIVRVQEASPYLPALGYKYSQNPTEVMIKHQERQAGESKYSFYKLLRLNFDIMTGYSIVPLQIFSLMGILISGGAACFFILLVVRRIFQGPEAEGVFTLFALLFFFLGICLFGLGLLGEYVGRIYLEVRKHPRFVIRETYQPTNKEGL